MKKHCLGVRRFFGSGCSFNRVLMVVIFTILEVVQVDAQIISYRNGVYGLNDQVSAEEILPQEFDTIFQLKFDYNRLYASYGSDFS